MRRAHCVGGGFTGISAAAEVIGKPALFSLSNGWAKFYQTDQHRKPVSEIGEF